MFVVASLVVLLIPGPNVLYVIARSMNQGRKAGVISVLGLEMGTMLQVAAAALSISAIVLSSRLAFDLVKYLGAAYLGYLGVRKLFERESATESTVSTSASLRGVFGQGVLVGSLNPKTALFFLAFLPQFVDAARGIVALQTLVLGLAFIGLATIILDSSVGRARWYVRAGVWREATTQQGRSLQGGATKPDACPDVPAGA
ncbi:MAG: LysE family translocator [Candidatus Methylophosphatis roskildensis]